MTQKSKSGVLAIVLASLTVIASLVFLGYVLKNDRADMREAGIYIDNGYVRVNGASATSAAAFMMIENTSKEDDRLIGVTANVSNMANLHSNKVDSNGMTMMRPIEGGLKVPANGTAALQRGGNHVMMMGLKQPLKQDDSVTLTLTFEKAGIVVVKVPVDLNR